MNILHIVTVPGFQIANDVLFFKKYGHNVTVLNMFHNYWNHIKCLPQYNVMNLYDNKILNNLYSKGFPYSKFVFSRLDIFIKKIKTIVENGKIDIILCGWDSGILIDALSLKKHFDIPVVFRFLMYPGGLSKLTVFLENTYFKNKIKNFDLRIWPSNIMYYYGKKTFHDISDGTKDIILFPFLSSEFSKSSEIRRSSYSTVDSNLIFLGSSDFSRSERNVNEMITKIADEKIHIHLMRPKRSEDIISHNYIHYFQPVSLGSSFIRFIANFDGVVVFYNLTDNMCLDRLNNVFPNRFIWAIAARLPIFLPENQLSSVKNMITDLGIGFTFNSYSQLKYLIAESKLITDEKYLKIEKLIDYQFCHLLNKMQELLI